VRSSSSHTPFTPNPARQRWSLDCLYRWPFVREVIRGSRYVCFVLTPLERMHIPVRAFRDDGHIHQFIRAAQSYVKTDAAKSL